MDTRVAAAFVNLRQTGGIVVALWTEASEAVDAINACAPVVAWVDGTVIDVNVAHCACKKVKEYFERMWSTLFKNGTTPQKP